MRIHDESLVEAIKRYSREVKSRMTLAKMVKESARKIERLNFWKPIRESGGYGGDAEKLLEGIFEKWYLISHAPFYSKAPCLAIALQTSEEELREYIADAEKQISKYHMR